ncbi:mechanosensitive ion channel family protein [Mycobacterium xenopi 3993]|nr:mechanosensitive ion channel family protein [Mycobacterium xenopi 3993]
MAVTETYLAQPWHDLWRGDLRDWILDKGLRVVLLLIGAVLAARFVNWAARKVTERLDVGFTESDALVRSEATKHRQAVAAVISWVAIVLIAVAVAVQIADILQLSIRGLVAPATVLGAALGFGAQQLVKDLLAGFFIIAEKQYGFGDLVELTILGSSTDAAGTVENVTLRVTKLRSPDGEVFTVPNGQIVKSVNLSKDWARAVVDIPVPTSADLGQVNEVLRQECEHARDDAVLRELLLDAPTVMGVESIGSTPSRCGWSPAPCPASSFRPAANYGCWWCERLRGPGSAPPMRHRRRWARSSTRPRPKGRGQDARAGPVKFALPRNWDVALKALKAGGADERRWPAYLFGGHLRTSTAALVIAFLALWWVHDTYRPSSTAPTQVPATQVVPPATCPTPTTRGCRAADCNSRRRPSR